MSIASDRREITQVLMAASWDIPMKVYAYAPSQVRGNMGWLELIQVEPPANRTYAADRITITWRLTITASATAQVTDAQMTLDHATDTALQAITSAAVADVTGVDPYLGITETNGATYPAVQITLESTTTITEG